MVNLCAKRTNLTLKFEEKKKLIFERPIANSIFKYLNIPRLILNLSFLNGNLNSGTRILPTDRIIELSCLQS